jgi:NAD(P)-dependent dehydrogenase (short-subunit alcohol dehydrogenase family)
MEEWSMARRLSGKVALVIGAGSVGAGWGNGRATAVLFAREGASVAVADIDEAALAETVRLIEEEGGVCAAQVGDATVSDDVAAMVATCVERFGQVDVLHANVGGSVPGGAADMPEEVWDNSIDFNLKSAFLACKHALPEMIRRKRGAIVTVSSVAGLTTFGERQMVSYQASKAGLIHFTRGVALDHAGDGIRANCVVPGLMNTPLVGERVAGQYGHGNVEATIAARDAQCPMGHMGDAWDVAYASLFLASDESKYVTGTSLVVDGGLTARSV